MREARKVSERAGRRFPGASLLRARAGAINLGCIVTILLVATAGYTAFRAGAPFYQFSSFESAVADMVPFYRNNDVEYIQKAVREIGMEFNIPLTPEQVKVNQDRKVNVLSIDIRYDVTVELPHDAMSFYTYHHKFTSHLTGAAF